LSSPNKFLKILESPDGGLSCDLVGKFCLPSDERGAWPTAVKDSGLSSAESPILGGSATLDDREGELASEVPAGSEDSALRRSISSLNRFEGECASA